ncbi:hypothetical protein AMJ86_04205 [bacterium SM23_57]|jgi:hypothetical protein|nr:MAG: hypothetical protein AMJ86_04205 [bacterium SM23_57]
MNQLLQWLSGNDLRSDGYATEVAQLVLENDVLLDDLLVGLDNSNPVIRGRTTDALEKVARVKPELLLDQLPRLIHLSSVENPMMVKMHIAMLLGHLLACDIDGEIIHETLLDLLEENSVFTRSWAIVSLCILARKFPHLKTQIIEHVVPLKTNGSIAIRSKADKALRVLLNDDIPFPKGWIKSEHLQDI